MKKLICILLCICILFSLAACAPEKSNHTDLSEKAQTIADTIVSDYGSTSVQYAIIDGGDIILSGGSGVYDKNGNRAVTKDDMYGIGSTSKMFVTAAAMTLVDKGLLDIDKPLTDYIPEFRMADERYKDITVRMLMNHSSGIYGASFSDSFLYDTPDTTAHDTILDRLALQSLKQDPGEMSEYCNDGFTLLELLVERLGNMSYSEFIARNFSEPLGLTHTKTPQDDFDRDELVRVYMPQYDFAMPNDTLNALGTGGLYSTAEDLCRFSEVLMGNRTDILSEESVSLMRCEEYKKGLWPEDNDENIFGYGLGWDTVHAFPFGDYCIQAVVKGGDTQLFHSSLVTIPKYDIAMAVISAGGSSMIDCTFASAILQELLLQKGIIKEISPQRTFAAPVLAEMPEELCGYSGVYAGATESDVVIKAGILTVTVSSAETTYVYIGNDTFVSDDGTVSVKFLHMKDGNTYMQLHSYHTVPGIGQFAMCTLNSQRVEPADVTQSVLDSWNERSGKKYYMVSESSSSQAYLIGGAMVCMQLKEDFSNGYALAGIKIANEMLAVNILKFRDVTDLTFFDKDGTEYLKALDLTYICEDVIPELTAAAECVIGADGYAKYYSVGTAAARKTMAVTLPKGAAYAVYDENDVCIDFSTVSHNSSTLLPVNGKVAFIGRAGDVFGIELQ